MFIQFQRNTPKKISFTNKTFSLKKDKSLSSKDNHSTKELKVWKKVIVKNKWKKLKNIYNLYIFIYIIIYI